MRMGSYSYESYLGVKYFKQRGIYYTKCKDGIYHPAIRCYLPTDDGNYIEFRTLTNCLAYIRALKEVEKAKTKLAMMAI